MGRETPSRLAMAQLLMPSPAANTMRARRAVFWGVLPDSARRRRVICCGPFSINGAAAVNMPPS